MAVIAKPFPAVIIKWRVLSHLFAFIFSLDSWHWMGKRGLGRRRIEQIGFVFLSVAKVFISPCRRQDTHPSERKAPPDVWVEGLSDSREGFSTPPWRKSVHKDQHYSETDPRRKLRGDRSFSDWLTGWNSITPLWLEISEDHMLIFSSLASGDLLESFQMLFLSGFPLSILHNHSWINQTLSLDICLGSWFSMVVEASPSLPQIVAANFDHSLLILLIGWPIHLSWCQEEYRVWRTASHATICTLCRDLELSNYIE